MHFSPSLGHPFKCHLALNAELDPTSTWKRAPQRFVQNASSRDIASGEPKVQGIHLEEPGKCAATYLRKGAREDEAAVSSDP